MIRNSKNKLPHGCVKTIPGSVIAVMSAVIFAVSLVMPVSIIPSKAATATEIGSWGELQSAIDAVEGTKEVSFKLSGDITAGKEDKAISVTGKKNIIIDLAGHTISRGLSEVTDDGYVIGVVSGGSVTLTDSTDNPGIIGGGANIGNGGGIYCEGSSELTITGGVRISGNQAKYGGGIYLGNDCDLYPGDCYITENTATVNGGGIYGGTSHISFLGGITRVKKNTKDGADNDLYMPAEMEKLRFWKWSSKNEKTRKQQFTEAFTRGTSIGILLEEMSSEISDGYGQINQAAASAYFFYDTKEYTRSRPAVRRMRPA